MTAAADQPIDNEIADFYLNPYRVNRHGFCFYDFVTWDDKMLEQKHNYIQWIFPNYQPSACQYSAPVLTEQQALLIINDQEAMARFKMAVARMVDFWKINECWSINTPNWTRTPAASAGVNHNCLRITRMIHAAVALAASELVGPVLENLVDKNVDHTEKRGYPIFSKTTTALWACAFSSQSVVDRVAID